MNIYFNHLKNILHKENQVISSTKFEFNDFNLPDDYLLLIKHYGTIKIDDFLYIINPNSNNQNLNFNASHDFIDSYKFLKETFPEDYKLNIFPKKESFFAWAVTDNGSTFNWFITDDNPNLWKTVILGSDPSEMEFFDMGCVEFLYSILIGKIKSTLMPDNFAISFSHSVREIS